MSDYHPRHATSSLIDRLETFPVVAVVGARQVGKSTLVQALDDHPRTFLTLDDLDTLDQARRAPATLLERDSHLIIDEAQRAPELFLAVKRAVDLDRRPGRFLLTGSAHPLLMKSIGDSLAGRAAYILLRPMTEREKRADGSEPVWSQILTAENHDEITSLLAPRPGFDWTEAALAGGLPPAALAAISRRRTMWFDAYVETYVHRDLRDLTQVVDLPAFARLVRLAALRTGGLLNQADLGRDAGVSRATASRWLGLLETTSLVTPLPAYHTSKSKRLIKAPKLYFGDTGLGLFLSGLTRPAAVRDERSSGAWLENLILNDLLAWREAVVPKPTIGHWRTASGQEIDFIVDVPGRRLPIEIKSDTRVRVDDARRLDEFCDEFADESPFALLLHCGDELFPLTPKTIAVPISAVL